MNKKAPSNAIPVPVSGFLVRFLLQLNTQGGEIDEVYSYVYALRSCKAFSPCDNTLHQFVLQDYNPITADLKVHKSMMQLHD